MQEDRVLQSIALHAVIAVAHDVYLVYKPSVSQTLLERN